MDKNALEHKHCKYELLTYWYEGELLGPLGLVLHVKVTLWPKCPQQAKQVESVVRVGGWAGRGNLIRDEVKSRKKVINTAERTFFLPPASTG